MNNPKITESDYQTLLLMLRHMSTTELINMFIESKTGRKNELENSSSDLDDSIDDLKRILCSKYDDEIIKSPLWIRAF